ncbi:Kinase [Hexamita inflata]|uniref:CAMK CAMKL n=1 Tax=Hexamita inflata TaxID=28002 RepID=A0AA86U7U4_9EUKA|nr:CAMK CAMKL [Hexamita inflata]
MQVKFQSLGNVFCVNGIQILSFVSQGGQSIVYKGSQNSIPVIVQVLPKDQSTRQRLKFHEQLSHLKQIVKLLQSFEVDSADLALVSKQHRNQFSEFFCSKIIAVFEFVPFGELNGSTFRSKTSSPFCNLFENKNQQYKIVQLFRRILMAVNEMHLNGVFHLDLKPENILSSENEFKIIDLGSAQAGVERLNGNLALKSDLACAYIFHSTKAYSSQIQDSVNGVVRCALFDVYSLGATLYYVLTNKYLPQQFPTSYMIQKFGYLITDLIFGMTNNINVRYTMEQCIDHPVFTAPQNISDNSAIRVCKSFWFKKILSYKSMNIRSTSCQKQKFTSTRLYDDSDIVLFKSSYKINPSLYSRIVNDKQIPCPEEVLKFQINNFYVSLQLQFIEHQKNPEKDEFIAPLLMSPSSDAVTIHEIEYEEFSDQVLRCTSRTYRNCKSKYKMMGNSFEIDTCVTQKGSGIELLVDESLSECFDFLENSTVEFENSLEYSE